MSTASMARAARRGPQSSCDSLDFLSEQTTSQSRCSWSARTGEILPSSIVSSVSHVLLLLSGYTRCHFILLDLLLEPPLYHYLFFFQNIFTFLHNANPLSLSFALVPSHVFPSFCRIPLFSDRRASDHDTDVRTPTAHRGAQRHV